MPSFDDLYSTGSKDSSSNHPLVPYRRRLFTVSQLCKVYPAFTPGGIRWLLFNRDTNGLASAVVRVGRRVLLDERVPA
jgi:hypothetical protein